MTEVSLELPGHYLELQQLEAGLLELARQVQGAVLASLGAD